MNKIKTTPLITLIFLGLFFISFQKINAESIKNFEVNIKVNEDSSLLITENILYDFESVEKHGIYREIPIKYQNDFKDKSLNLEVQSVKRDSLNENFVVSNSGDNKNIKIGEADSLISGEHLYSIVYSVRGAIGFFDIYDEVYWNVTGNSWQVPIENSKVTVELPYAVDMSTLQNSCYVGVYGSKENCNINVLDNTLIANVDRVLSPSEGFTIAVGFQKGVVNKPSIFVIIKNIIFNNLILLLPFIVFIIMFRKWKKEGKDPKKYLPIIAQYEPPELIKPTLVGFLVDGNLNERDITAGIIYLAEQGFVKITKLEKINGLNTYDYQLELLKNDISHLEGVEKDILDLFFDELTIGKIVKISELNKTISSKAKRAYLQVNTRKETEERGFYEINSNKLQRRYLIGCALALFALVFVMPVFAFFFGKLAPVAVIVSWVIVFIFSLKMDKRTELGVKIKNHILGFKLFLSVTEKDRLNFHNAPERNPEQFMEYLPYAIALGVEKKWAKQFENIYISEPSWYTGGVSGTFIASNFASSISNLASSFNTVASGGSGSGGGGGAGGGGGGGGGGSW